MTEPAEATQKPIPDVGAVLREARQDRGQTIESVYQHTRIPKKFLEALEANQFDVFPAKVYLQGFLRNYCDHLELDFESLWNRIYPPKLVEKSQPESPAAAAMIPAPAPNSAAPAPQSSAPSPIAEAPKARPEPARAKPEPARRETAAAARPAPQVPPKRQPSPPPTQPPRSTLPETEPPEASRESSPWILLVLLGVGIAFGVIWMLNQSKQPPAAPPMPRQPAAITPIKSTEKMNLKLVFRREAWVRLHCDGRLRFEGRGPAGFSQVWSAMNEFVLRVPNPDDVGLFLDGKQINLDPTLKDSSGDYKIARP